MLPPQSGAIGAESFKGMKSSKETWESLLFAKFKSQSSTHNPELPQKIPLLLFGLSGFEALVLADRVSQVENYLCSQGT